MGYTKMIFRLDETFGRDQCAFFDPSVKHGGPNPDAAMTGMREAKNPNAKAPTKPRRLRRSDDDLDVCDGKNESECNEAAFEGLECEPEDMLEGSENYEFCKAEDDLDGEKGKRSMSQPNRKLKRYSAGLASGARDIFPNAMVNGSISTASTEPKISLKSWPYLMSKFRLKNVKFRVLTGKFRKLQFNPRKCFVSGVNPHF